MECNYPDCVNCNLDDCVMDETDLKAMLKRRRWKDNPEFYRQNQREYRARVRKNLPHCDECTRCVLVKKDKGDGFRRLCVKELRLIEQKVSNSPHWCPKRLPKEEREYQRYLKREEAKQSAEWKKAV